MMMSHGPGANWGAPPQLCQFFSRTTRKMDSAQTSQSHFTLFSPKALSLLPRLSRPKRYLRADAIPDGQQSTVRDYHAINLPPQVRVPKKIPTPIHVEGKVWFANERSKYLLNFQ